MVDTFRRIAQQEAAPEGVLTTYEDGERVLLPYTVDQDGQRYMDLDPNKDVFPESLRRN